MQIPILSGREFEARDEVGERGFNRTILVSESFARRYWPGQTPLGKRIGSTIGTPDWWMTVVGVVGDVRYTGLEAAPTEEVYLPAGLYPQAAITLVARTVGDPLDETSEVLARVRDVDPHAFVTDVRSMDEVIAGSQAERRAGALLVAAFGLLALVLVIAGVYSVIAQAVVQRELELAIRAALGAGPWTVAGLAMRTALQPAAVGIALGLAVAVGASRMVASVLFGVGALDVATWVAACGVMLAACVTAGYLPARRAARIDSAPTSGTSMRADFRASARRAAAGPDRRARRATRVRAGPLRMPRDRRVRGSRPASVPEWPTRHPANRPPAPRRTAARRPNRFHAC